MTDSLRDLLFGGFGGRRELVEAVEPRRSFDDVILPPSTRRQLGFALSLIQHHGLIYEQWGLGERHEAGRGLAFHFAGPPGTGKTICAEAIAHALGKRLLVVRYSELESMWAGQTAKHIVEVFRAAERQDAVLFFDEADAIAGRRFAGVERGYEREANAVVNVLLHELELFQGVVIFATNLAANIDPAFERRILTHILFERPNREERERIWRVQFHPTRTPLAEDVDFAALAEAHELSGGDIRNAAIKAAQMAAAQPGPDERKRIEQQHLRQGVEEVVRAGTVMEQSLYAGRDGADPGTALARAQRELLAEQAESREALVQVGARLDALDRLADQLVERLDELGDAQRTLAARLDAPASADTGRAVAAAIGALGFLLALVTLVLVFARG
jgi:DNA polymerase III delta prime subunit